MPLSAYQSPLATNPEDQLTEALTVNQCTPTVSLNLPWRNPVYFVRGIYVVSVEALVWEVWLFSSATNLGGTMDDKFIAMWQFNPPPTIGPPAYPGYPIDDPDESPDDGFYRYYIEGNMMPGVDHDFIGQPATAQAFPRLHFRLINRSSAAKTEGEGGAIKVTWYIAPQGLQA